ncbi:hypothetical protein AR1Y2_2372 [Anaerostipes rhamnosivorans]|uniref:Uncharacterized protein n=1 Tax=Anaerostipes rhamnosivorans TaxID=1229621 RepID=A0A4P8IEL9_9FIRM|nr:hypothetical protein AR1Y2_2372 [Anaerostipes rhamnosivorans]
MMKDPGKRFKTAVFAGSFFCVGLARSVLLLNGFPALFCRDSEKANVSCSGQALLI